MVGTTTRRGFAILFGAGIVGVGRSPGHAELSPPMPSPNDAEWILFRDRFISQNGRVIDTGNGNASHSEGQGWALLMAEAHDDRGTFERVLKWTLRELRRPNDSLHAWSWKPNRPRPVEDANNATDGDIFIAWALARADRRWGRPDLLKQAIAIRDDLERLCIRQVAGRTVLLPAAFGFEHRSNVVVNPSYYVFPAFSDLAALTAGAVSGSAALTASPWMALHRDGLTLLREARFGRWGLPADWVGLARTGGRASPAQQWVPRFSYDAVRVPLYLTWAGLAMEPAARAADAFWNHGGYPYQPAWAEFAGDRIAPYPVNSGQRAVALLAAHPGPGTVALPSIRDAQDYYAGALTMLSHIAMAERLPLLA
jgi:endoglucanase